MPPETLEERIPVRIAHAGRDPGATVFVQRKHVFLPIVALLETMLGRAQETVRRAQRFHRMGREQTELAETLEHRQQSPVPERGRAPARTI